MFYNIILILVFEVRQISAPMTCFIMYNQPVVLEFYEECGVASVNSVLTKIKFTDNESTIKIGTRILLTLYGVFILDFFHYILPPFCLSSKLRPYFSWLHISILPFSVNNTNLAPLDQ